MTRLLLLFILTIICIGVVGQTKYEKDFESFTNIIHKNYAYLNQQNIDWQKVENIYKPQIVNIQNDREFIRLLENMLLELHNGHSSLNVNLNTSNRLIPSGQDLYVEEIKGKFWITDVKKGSNADLAGVFIGSEVIKFNGREIKEQLSNFLPRFTNSYTNAMKQFALDMLFAGTHDKKRSIEVLINGREQTIELDNKNSIKDTAMLTVKRVSPSKVCIKINNCLWNNDLIAAFDKTLDSLLTTPILILDLTDTPSGGNSTVARAIMGRFVNKPYGYQQHEYDETDFDTKRHWIEYVYPRKKVFKGRLYVMVGHWTGSMGEGMAIGFDSFKKPIVVGTKMAGLLGAIDGFHLKETNINFQIPTERLYHVDGKPRESFAPRLQTQNSKQTWKSVLKAK
jgi:carboxyl-terminal processing protease